MAGRLYFSISEFIRRPDLEVPLEVIDRILEHHIWIMNPIRAELGVPVSVSQKSGFRPVEHEEERGRSGESEHTFRDDIEFSAGKGAADYSCSKLEDLARMMAEETPYTRLVIYPNSKFIHGDYKFPQRGQRFFIAEADGWRQVEKNEFIQAAAVL